MIQKSLILTLFLFSLFIELVHSKKERPNKFLPKTPVEKTAAQSYLQESQDYLSFEEEAKVINVKCLFSKNYNFYSLQALQDKEKDYELKQGEYTYIYNFCQNTKANSNSTLVRRDADGNEVKLAGNIDGEGNDKNNWLEISDGDKKDGISIALAKGETCLENASIYAQAEVYLNRNTRKPKKHLFCLKRD